MMIKLIKRIAYGYGLRDELNAHKWILRNLVKICSQYENALGCDPWCTIDDVVFMRSFLDYSKTFLGIQSFPGDEGIKKMSVYFDYAALRNSTKAGEFDYELQGKVMGAIFQILMPLLRTYQNRVKASAYYWAFKDPEYLKLVVTTDIPDETNKDEICKYGFRSEYDEEFRKERSFGDFISEVEKKYGLANNELFIKFANL